MYGPGTGIMCDALFTKNSVKANVVHERGSIPASCSGKKQPRTVDIMKVYRESRGCAGDLANEFERAACTDKAMTAGPRIYACGASAEKLL